MRVKILRLGSSAHEVEVNPGSTVGEAMDKAGVPHGGHSLSVNGLGASLGTALGEGDVVTLVPKVEGGGR
jgi:sulfur carrier protein ThiS